MKALLLLILSGIPLTLAMSNLYRSRYWPAGSAALPLVTGMLMVQSLGLLLTTWVQGAQRQPIARTST
jgi:hypothetical protein